MRHQYAWAVLLPAVVTVVALALRPDPSAWPAIACLYLVAVTAIAFTSRWPAVLVTLVTSYLILDYFFVGPPDSLSIPDSADGTFAGFVLAGTLVAGTLGWSRAREQRLLVSLALAQPPAPRGGRRLKIVYLDHCAELSGGEIALLRLLAALPDVEAHVILAEEGPLRAALEEAGVATEVLSLNPRIGQTSRLAVRPSVAVLTSAAGVVAYAWRLRRLIRRQEPDLVHTNSLKSAVYGALAARFAGVPVLCHLRDRLATDYMPGPAVRLMRGYLRLVPNAVVLLNAFARAFPDHDARCVLVGSAMFDDAPYEQRLRHEVEQLGLDDCVELTGFTSDVGRQLARFDVLVHASIVAEPFGQVVVEGMAAGLPVIATGLGGPGEIVTDGVDGLLYPPGDVEALAALLLRVRQSEDLRASLGAAARQRAEDFLPSRIGAKVDAAYRVIVDRHPKRRDEIVA